MVVHPDHQRQGLGTRLMDAVMAYVDEHAPPNAYVNLTVDVDGFYEHSKVASRFSRTSERAF